MKSTAPIGMFDSGLGGLSVWLRLREMLPHESVVYYADSGNCPYGNRSEEDIQQLSSHVVDFLLNKGAKIIVVACNTATSAAIAYLREKYSHISFIGMEPAVKPAAQLTLTGHIGILATKGTITGKKFNETSQRFTQGIEVHTAIGEGLVELVESGKAMSQESLALLRHYIDPMLQQGVDQLVLGCTHYPFLSEAIYKIAGDRLNLIDPAPAVVRRVQQVLAENDALAPDNQSAVHQFYTSGDLKILKEFLAQIAPVNRAFLFDKAGNK